MEKINYKKTLANLAFNELKFEYLTDRQLIKVIELAQQELDNRYSIDLPQSLKCPACGQTDQDFWTSCYYVAIVNSDEAYVPTDIDANPTWGAENGCTCEKCQHSGIMLDFLPSGAAL